MWVLVMGLVFVKQREEQPVQRRVPGCVRLDVARAPTTNVGVSSSGEAARIFL